MITGDFNHSVFFREDSWDSSPTVGDRLLIKENDKHFVTITVNDDHVFVSHLQAVPKLSGTEIVKEIKQIPRNSLPLRLHDASEVEIHNTRVSLALIKLISNGESWYNSHGFVSETDTQEKRDRKKIFKMRMKEARQLVKDNVNGVSTCLNKIDNSPTTYIINYRESFDIVFPDSDKYTLVSINDVMMDDSKTIQMDDIRVIDDLFDMYDETATVEEIRNETVKLLKSGAKTDRRQLHRNLILFFLLIPYNSNLQLK